MAAAAPIATTTRRDLRRALPGRDPSTALMESVFHKHQWLADEKRSIALKEVESRLVRAVGPGRRALGRSHGRGCHGGLLRPEPEQLASRDYTHTQQVSAQVHAMLGDDGQPLFDGCSIRRATTILPRASPCSSVRQQESALSMTSTWWTMDWPRFVATYRVGVEPDPGPVEPDDEAS